MKITFMDVGQGDGVVIRIPGGKTVCIDGGSSYISGLAKYRIEPYLNYEGIKHIDYWIITHMDNDHYSGLKEVLERHRYNGITVDNIVIADTQICRDEFFAKFLGSANGITGEITGEITDKMTDEIINEATNILYMNNNHSLVSGDVIMRCLNPDTSYEYGNQNESSIVLELSYGDFDALFTGDVEGEPERMLHIDRDKQYEVLKVAHHGSKNSTCEEFLNKFNCRNAVISYGRDNRYGHPHAETTDALGKYGYNIYKTAEGGAVTVSVDESGYVIEEYYQQ
ncbi:MAG: MBL fold metallo-hydrolase [Lachnospiraceae bacterium]|nr:MBL fold metallo-hydrolase [Lachnospiraceae bacterium]